MHVLRGSMKIVVGDVSHLLNQGDTICFDGDRLKESCSASDDVQVIICCITPPVL
jgi:uncharacterized cupin superfamily protein